MKWIIFSELVVIYGSNPTELWHTVDVGRSVWSKQVNLTLKFQVPLIYFDLKLTRSSYFEAVAVTTACCSNQNLTLFIFFPPSCPLHQRHQPALQDIKGASLLPSMCISYMTLALILTSSLQALTER
jgi:hypothetical protein